MVIYRHALRATTNISYLRRTGRYFDFLCRCSVNASAQSEMKCWFVCWDLTELSAQSGNIMPTGLVKRLMKSVRKFRNITVWEHSNVRKS